MSGLKAAVVLLCLSVAVSANAATITIGQLPIGNQPEIVADELGLYKKQGLDVEVKIFRDGPAMVQGLLAGDLQMVDAGVVPMLHLAAQGIPLYFLASTGINTPESPLGTIMIRPDDQTIKSFTDLKGKRLGQLGKGVNTYLWLFDATAHYGMKRDDFQEIFVPFPQMGGMLGSGQVDAVYAWAPFDTLISQAGKGRVLMTDTAWNPYCAAGAVAVQQGWADKNPEIVGKLVSVAIEVNRWIDDHPAEARRIIGKRLGLSDSVSGAMRLAFFPRNGYQLMPSVWDIYYLMVKTGEMAPLAAPQSVFEQYWIKPEQRFIAPVLSTLKAEADPEADELRKIKLPDLPKSPAAYYAPWDG
jgi:ABC-type nitrate/sulfonate/bicarbonate transport system substrate-binding protein